MDNPEGPMKFSRTDWIEFSKNDKVYNDFLNQISVRVKK